MGIFNFFKRKRAVKAHNKRVNFNELYDVEKVTHHEDKPFTGIAFSLHEGFTLFGQQHDSNGATEEECEYSNGLKHGKGSIFDFNNNLLTTITYKDDIIVEELHFDNSSGKETIKIIFNNKGKRISSSKFIFLERKDCGSKISIPWLKGIGPVYQDNGESDLHHNTLYSDTSEVFITVNNAIKIDVVDVVLKKFGGEKNFQVFKNSKGLKDSFILKSGAVGGLVDLYVGQELTVLCKDHMIFPFLFSEIIIKSIDNFDIMETLNLDELATEETSQSSFAKGWILNEMKSAFLFTTLSTSDALKVNFGVDDLRRATIIEFIQMCYKNTYQINSIENNLEWRNFIHNALNEKLTKDVLSVLMDMQFNKKLELLFLLKTLTNATIELVKKSGKNNEEMNSIISHMNDILSNTEKMFKIFPSKAEYDDVYNKYCDEDDRQRQEM